MRKKLILVVALAIGCGCSPGLESPEGRYTAEVRARALFENGHLDRAATVLSRLSRDSRDATAWANLGLVRYREGKRTAAERAWTRATEVEPGCARAHFWLGVSRRERAQEMLHNAASDPDHAARLREQGTEFLKSAAQALEAAAGADPTEPLVQQILVLVYQDLGNTKQAERANNEAKRLDPAGLASLERSGYSMVQLPLRPGTTMSGWIEMRFAAQRVAEHATGVGAADLDQDGRSELVLLGTGGVAACDSSSQGMRWSRRDLLPEGNLARFGLRADIDVDGKSDLLLFGNAPESLATRLWLVRGGAANLVARVPYFIDAVRAADVDQDGDPDLLVATGESPGLRLWRNDNGRFEIDAKEPSLDKLPPLRDLVCADFNDDRLPDLVCVDRSGRLRVLLRTSDGRFADVSPFAGLATQKARALAAADLDADGWMDLVLGDDAGLWVYQNRGAARFVRRAAYRPSQTTYATEATPRVPVTALLLADIDNDGLVDVVTSHPSESGAQAPGGAPATLAARTGEAKTLDGKPIEDATPEPPLAVYSAATALRVWRNDGRGVLLDSSEKLEIVADTLLAVAPVAADFDGDGDLDLACVSQDSTVVVRWNEGGNTNRRLLVTLAGPRGPGDGLGARLELHGGSLVQNVEVDEQPVWLGAQRATHLDVVRIAWRDGTVENRFEVDIPPAGTWHFTRSAGR